MVLGWLLFVVQGGVEWWLIDCWGLREEAGEGDWRWCVCCCCSGGAGGLGGGWCCCGGFLGLVWYGGSSKEVMSGCDC